MNLLTDPWLPVRAGGQFKHITLKEALCHSDDWHLAAHRDDMEMAALQLAVCLTQVVLMPENAALVRARERTPLSVNEYDTATAPFLEWFELEHPEHPFMQTRGVKAEAPTPIQKLFVGLPEGNNHAFFNNAGEITRVCGKCAAIALFNLASNCPSFGGGFKGSLRGAAPITTLVKWDNLRSSIWRNVLHREFLAPFYKVPISEDRPTWVKAIEPEEKIFYNNIGLLRGLFWQPAHIELLWQEISTNCHFCGMPAARVAIGFNKEKFKYEIEGIWLHPHSPRTWRMKQGSKEEKYASFTTTAPAWTQLNTLLVEKEQDKEGHTPALVVSHYREVFPGQPLHMAVGGYRNNQAAILERRHEMFSLPEGWEQNLTHVEQTVDLALEIKKLLRDKLYGFGKQISITALANRGEERFYQDSQLLIHSILREMKWKEARDSKQRLAVALIKLAKNLFREITQPYQHEPKAMKALAASRRSLFDALNQIV